MTTASKKAAAPAKAEVANTQTGNTETAAAAQAQAAAGEKSAAASGGEQAQATDAGDTKASTKADKKSTNKVAALKVSSLREGFRRGGRAWSKEAQIVKLSDLTKDQIAQIKSEPMLAVIETEVDE